MKKFLVKVGIFFALLLVINLALFITTAYFVRKNTSFKLPDAKNILVLGDSQTETSINDSLLTNVANVSQSADAYLYSYVKLKLFLDQNPQLDTILLSISYTNLNKEKDLWVTDTRYSWKIQTYLPFFRPDDYVNFMFNKEFHRLWFRMPFYNKNFFLKRYTYSDLDFGGYEYLERQKLEEDLKNQSNTAPEPTLKSSYQEKYLFKIIEECKSRHVQLIFLTPPIYAKRINNFDTARYYRYYREKLHEYPLLDFSDLSFPDSYYGDIEHLNFNGAKAFTPIFQQRLVEIHRKRLR
ncbi:MAG: hypothetical protein ACOVMQ_07750 [Cyclobacteriaceae bacterium]